MSSKKPQIPVSTDHLRSVEGFASVARQHSQELLRQLEQDGTLQLLGTALSALYQAATCHRKCHESGHVLESLCGRAYNLACASYLLCVRGLYDESLSLTRSIGEIANIVTLSIVDGKSHRKWLLSEPQARIKHFSPGRVRALLEQKKAGSLVYANKNWYSRLSKEYTHVGPDTRPNRHNEDELPIAGPVFQEEGVRTSVLELASIVGVLALQVCEYFQFEDLFERMMSEVDPRSESTEQS